MTSVCVIGSTGMLGSAVGKYFLGLEKYDVSLTFRNPYVAYGDKRAFAFDPLIDTLSTLPKADYYLNCIGAIKPQFAKNARNSIYLNAVFPHDLATWAERNGSKLIHITTDCVWSGAKGQYIETDPHDALDDYGKSKSLGEPKNAMVIRTSIIGTEIHNQASLIAWCQSQAGKEISGYTSHFWSGQTTLQYAKVCEQIIDRNLYQNGLYHVFSDNLTKYELLQLISDAFKLDLKVKPVSPGNRVDRSLQTIHGLCEALGMPKIEKQLAELAEFSKNG